MGQPGSRWSLIDFREPEEGLCWWYAHTSVWAEAPSR